jgi:hypothetical protein
MKMVKVATAIVLTNLIALSFNSANATITQKLLKPVIESQCKQELATSKTWKVATILMSSSNQEKMQNNVCQCVGQHAMDDVKTTDVLKASISEEAKNTLIKQAVINSVKGCVAEVLQ